jgi:hypothetical protein
LAGLGQNRPGKAKWTGGMRLTVMWLLILQKVRSVQDAGIVVTFCVWLEDVCFCI